MLWPVLLWFLWSHWMTASNACFWVTMRGKGLCLNQGTESFLDLWTQTFSRLKHHQKQHRLRSGNCDFAFLCCLGAATMKPFTASWCLQALGWRTRARKPWATSYDPALRWGAKGLNQPISRGLFQAQHLWLCLCLWFLCWLHRRFKHWVKGFPRQLCEVADVKAKTWDWNGFGFSFNKNKKVI